MLSTQLLLGPQRGLFHLFPYQNSVCLSVIYGLYRLNTMFTTDEYNPQSPL